MVRGGSIVVVRSGSIVVVRSGSMSVVRGGFCLKFSRKYHVTHYCNQSESKIQYQISF